MPNVNGKKFGYDAKGKAAAAKARAMPAKGKSPVTRPKPMSGSLRKMPRI